MSYLRWTNLLRQTVASRCESSTTFQRLIPSHLQGATDDLVPCSLVYIPPSPRKIQDMNIMISKLE